MGTLKIKCLKSLLYASKLWQQLPGWPNELISPASFIQLYLAIRLTPKLLRHYRVQLPIIAQSPFYLLHSIYCRFTPVCTVCLCIYSMHSTTFFPSWTTQTSVIFIVLLYPGLFSPCIGFSKPSVMHTCYYSLLALVCLTCVDFTSLRFRPY